MTSLLDQPDSNGAESRRLRQWPWVAAALAIGGTAFVLFWFQPQKLFTDERVDEAIPVATTVAGEPPPADDGGNAAQPSPARTEPVELARGSFVSIDHGTSGTVRAIELPDGTRIMRFEGLDTSNGPDLFVYLSANPASGDEAAFDDDVVNLGRLKGNQGDQNYELPADVDLARFASVVIWCDRFDSAFGAADLMAA